MGFIHICKLLQETTAFGGGKETRVQWLGNEDQILATGINKVVIKYHPSFNF